MLATTGFRELTPEHILDGVEKMLDRPLSNLCRPMNSYINRVYELADTEGSGFMVKFYRPGRWTREALLEEHRFLLELAEEEVPVIAPLPLADQGTLGELAGYYFALFPKKGGRFLDEFSEEQWVQLGHLLGRTHLLGACGRAPHRPVMRPDLLTAKQVAMVCASGLLPKDIAVEFARLCDNLINRIAPLFTGARLQRIHGDCHFGNIIYRPGEGFVLIDFDDMATGPPIQDIWMLLPGPPEDCARELALLLEGYVTFQPFDHSSMLLIEPLRAMRFIHYIAWCTHQVLEDGRTQVAPDFGSRRYWQQELADLADQLMRIDKMSG